MEDKAQLLRRFHPSLGITMHVSSAFDVSCDSRSTISHAALGPRTKPWCTSGNHASGDRRPSLGKGWRRSARLGWIRPGRRLRRTCPRTISPRARPSSILSLSIQRKNLRPIGKTLGDFWGARTLEPAGSSLGNALRHAAIKEARKRWRVGSSGGSPTASGRF